jgi:hypothetical protein
MHVQVPNLLPGILTYIHHEPISRRGYPGCFGSAIGSNEKVPQHGLILTAIFRGEVAPWDHHQMHR